jgi:predicted nucleic acid-binding Zn ribbon protein
VLRGLGAPPADILTRVVREWSSVVGELVAAHARPVTISGGRLVVVVDDPVYATRVRFVDGPLRAWLDEVAGADAVAGVDVRVVPR